MRRVLIADALAPVFAAMMAPLPAGNSHQIGPGRRNVLSMHRQMAAHRRRAAERRKLGRWAN